MVAPAVQVETLRSINPATGDSLAQVETTPPSAFPAILARARTVQSSWRDLPLKNRLVLLHALQMRILEKREALADLVSRESGKPRVEALFADVFVALDTAAYFFTEGRKLLQPEPVPHHSLAAKAKRGMLHYDPLGVVAIVSSWNYPLAIPLSQIIPAVAAGNAVVCKTSEFTPQCGLAIESLFLEAGFPKDLVTVVQGGGEVGQALIDAAPDKVFFTGSVATGRRVAEACAAKLIPSVLELGGKDAMLVLSDADLELTSSAAVWGSFTNCGQVCLSVERLFVERSVSEKFIRMCVEKTGKLRVGSGADPETDVGPLIRPRHVRRISDLLADAEEKGARLLCGGRPRSDLGPCFFEPTVITGVDSTMRLFQEETFGPILAIQTVADEEEAIRRANDSPFTLAASVWTSDNNRGECVAKRLRAGAVMVNDLISYFAIAEAPHGGSGASGWGRTHGRAGLMEMVQTKYIDVDKLSHAEKPWWYRYNKDLDTAANAFLEFEFRGGLLARLKNTRSALKTFFRNHGFS
jgi:acyl-CoA reductase-like NAD-dependent aldehyde dehydrogenase